MPLPRPTLFPYTTLFRSRCERVAAADAVVHLERVEARPRAERIARMAHSCPVVDGGSQGPPERRPHQRELRMDIDHPRSEEHTSELQSHVNLVCRPPLEK